jgi:hypothetical protein
MSHFHLDSHSFLSLNSFLTSSTKSFKYGKSCNVKHHKLGLADCCLMPTQQFFSYTMARWNDDEVRFVLDQHAKLDFYRLANWNNNPQIDMSPHSDTLSWFQPNPSLGFLLTAVCFKQFSGEATKVIIFSSPDPKGHVSYCHHWASVVRPLTFHILINSSEATGPIWTKLWWNGPWMAPFQNCVRWSRLPTKMAAKLKIEKGGMKF